MTDKPTPARRHEKVSLVFYATSTGAEPVRRWLKEMATVDRRLIGQDLMTAQFAWPVGMPLCRPMGKGLYEIRTELQDRIARVFVCFVNGKLIALHGIIKKTQQTSPSDLDLARKRQADVLRSIGRTKDSAEKK